MKLHCSLLISFVFFCGTSHTTLSDCPQNCYCQITTVKCMLIHLQSIPLNLPQDTTILDLRFNEVKNLSKDSFSNIKSLESLLLNNNQISFLQNDIFNGNFTQLHSLYLHKNRITTIEPGTFRNLHNLQQLFLHYNNIIYLQNGVFEGLTNLDRLFLHNNNLKTFSTDIFFELLLLKHLRLDGNRINCSCEVFWSVNELLESDRKSNMQISGVCEEPFSLHGRSITGLSTAAELEECHYPQFKNEFESREIFIDRQISILLHCNAVGYPKPIIIWKKDGNILNLRNKNFKQLPNGLEINSISLNDEGIYECTATNEKGSITSKSTTLKIKKKIEKLTGTVSPPTIISNEGETVQLECFIQGNYNLPVSWYNNNLILREIPSKIKLSNNGSLILINVQLEDSGKYDCVTTESTSFILGSSELIVNAAPKITSYPRSFTVGTATVVELQCTAIGNPIPLFTWFKDGRTVVQTSRITFKNNTNVLQIENTEESDSGMYTCSAQNLIGSAERNTEIRVKNKGPRVPRITIKPFDIDVIQFSSIEIPCKTDGEPIPKVRWLKNDKPINTNKLDRFRMNNINSLRIYNVSVTDSGVYECVATNIYGNDSASGILTVIGDFYTENDERIVEAFNEAKLEIERAINATVNHLFVGRKSSKSPEFLMIFFRYPDEFARNLVKSADIYARTLSIIRRHIASGLKLNLTDDFSYNEILSSSQLELIANLSGCVTHQFAVNCSDTEFHSKYSTLDGTCNNLKNPMWGSSHTAFRRILKPIYENGFSTPVGWNRDYLYNGFHKPAARLVSTSIIRTHDISSDEEITHMVMQWGQFLDHDLDHALPSTTAESWEGLDCKKTCSYSEPCFPMEVPVNDSRIKNRRCMDFIRSSAVCGSGDTSVFFNDLQPRQQLNQLTSYIDGSQVYGFTRDRSFLLRDLQSDLGLLRGGISTSDTDKLYLPVAGVAEMDCRRDLTESSTGCFLAGDIRVNEQVGLITMHTIWFREHNRLATELKEINPHWIGETLYYEARKILIAEIQHITYEYWLPLIIGSNGMKILGPYTEYDSDVDVTISNVFATAALRFGHALINPELGRLDDNFNVIPQGNLPLGKAFFSPWRLIDEGGIDPLLRGLFVNSAKRKKPNQNLNDQLTDELFTAAHPVSLDLAAMNIQRSRDHGLPGYIEYRRFCNLSVPETFEDLRNDISNVNIRNKLKQLYGHPGNIDVWVGGILEDQINGARVGPLFQCLLIEQFRRLRDGDRFWYENSSVFTPSQLTQIKRSSLARILCDNGNDITKITKNVFLLPHLQTPEFISCSDVMKIDLYKWR